jgi:hypothetical protein
MAALKIEQAEWLRGSQSFEVRDGDDFVKVATNFKGTLNEFQVPLNIIHPEPNRFKANNRAGLFCMILFGLLSLLMLMLSFHEPAFLMMLVFFVPMFIAGLVQFRRMSVDAQIFRSRINGQNLLVIWRDLPDKTVFDEFISAFQGKLKKVDVPVTGPTNQSIADEIRKLGELKKDGLLSETEFTEAKARLLGLLEKRDIGFR